jgi:negative regulator of sigma-B (phosphoserine phosphatase)
VEEPGLQPDAGGAGDARATTVACLDWAVAGRPLPGEDVSGDLAACMPVGDGALLATIDGLGHGAEAAKAAEIARDTIAAHSSEPLAGVLRHCHVGLARTRGAAITLARVQCGASMVQWVGVGNVEAHLIRRGESGHGSMVASAMLFGGTAGYRLPRLRESVVEYRTDDLLIMATDGLNRDFVPEVVTGRPVDRIAATILDRHARATDDALVVVARVRG